MIEEMRGNKPFRETSAHLMVCSFLLHLNRITYDSLHQVPAVYENVLYLNVCDYINNHLDEDLSLDHLASFFYASKYHISHVFKDNMGISLHQYILKKRLQASKMESCQGFHLVSCTISTVFQIIPVFTVRLKRNSASRRRNSGNRSPFRRVIERSPGSPAAGSLSPIVYRLSFSHLSPART